MGLCCTAPDLYEVVLYHSLAPFVKMEHGVLLDEDESLGSPHLFWIKLQQEILVNQQEIGIEIRRIQGIRNLRRHLPDNPVACFHRISIPHKRELCLACVAKYMDMVASEEIRRKPMALHRIIHLYALIDKFFHIFPFLKSVSFLF